MTTPTNPRSPLTEAAGAAVSKPPVDSGARDYFASSDDGSTRCRACQLHPDQCTCDPEHPMWTVLAPLFGNAASARGETP